MMKGCDNRRIHIKETAERVNDIYRLMRRLVLVEADIMLSTQRFSAYYLSKVLNKPFRYASEPIKIIGISPIKGYFLRSKEESNKPFCSLTVTMNDGSQREFSINGGETNSLQFLEGALPTVGEVISGEFGAEAFQVFKIWEEAIKKEAEVYTQIQTVKYALAELTFPFRGQSLIKIPYAKKEDRRYVGKLEWESVDLRPVFMAPEKFPDLTFYTLHGKLGGDSNNEIVYSSMFKDSTIRLHSCRAFEWLNLAPEFHSPTWDEVIEEINK